MDAKVYDTKEIATPEAGYHEKQKGDTSHVQQKKGSSHHFSHERTARGCQPVPMKGIWWVRAVSSEGLRSSG